MSNFKPLYLSIKFGLYLFISLSNPALFAGENVSIKQVPLTGPCKSTLATSLSSTIMGQRQINMLSDLHESQIKSRGYSDYEKIVQDIQQTLIGTGGVEKNYPLNLSENEVRALSDFLDVYIQSHSQKSQNIILVNSAKRLKNHLIKTGKINAELFGFLKHHSQFFEVLNKTNRHDATATRIFNLKVKKLGKDSSQLKLLFEKLSNKQPLTKVEATWLWLQGDKLWNPKSNNSKDRSAWYFSHTWVKKIKDGLELEDHHVQILLVKIPELRKFLPEETQWVLEHDPGYKTAEIPGEKTPMSVLNQFQTHIYHDGPPLKESEAKVFRRIIRFALPEYSVSNEVNQLLENFLKKVESGKSILKSDMEFIFRHDLEISFGSPSSLGLYF